MALSATAELTLSQLARAVGTSPSGAQRALEILLEDGVAERVAGTHPSYRLCSTETSDHIVALAVAERPLAGAIAIAARANPAIEFVARENTTMVVVLSAQSTALDQARAARCMEALATRNRLQVAYRDHDEVRRELLAEPELRRRMARAEILYGNLDRTFPDRSRHAMQSGRPLRRTHRSLRLPSRYALRSLARRHEVEALRLFGSAVRTDFRPDSDVDVLVRYLPGVRPTLRAMIQLERSLESTFGRDVDLVREENLGPELRERVGREAVSLL
jgi:predicted nucleotidyltransferase